VLTRLIPFVLALAWGLNWPAVKIVLSALPPFSLRVLGMGSAAVLLLAVAAVQKKRLAPAAGAWPGILIGGLLTVAVFSIATAWAQLTTSTSRAAVLTFSMPMMSAILAWFVLGERPDLRKGWALALGFAGVIVLAWPVLRGAMSAGNAHGLAGLFFPLTGALSWAAGTVYMKRWPIPGDRLVVAAWQLAVGAVCALVGALILGDRIPAQVPEPRVVAALVFHIVVGTALAYWLWFILSERLSATVASLTTLMVPVVGVLGAMALVGDRPAAGDYAGFVLVLAGAALIVLKLPDGSGRGSRPVEQAVERSGELGITPE
jgi:drug/metabolite transporter (DMT)-like permease